MAQQVINIGASPNDGTGDFVRDAFDKTNDNFTELYSSSGGGGGGAHVLTEPISGQNYSATVLAVAGYSTNSTQANRLLLIPFIPANSLTIQSMSFDISGGTAGSNVRLLIYSNNGGSPDLKLFESANISSATSGLKTYNVSFTFEAGVTYWIGTHSSAIINHVCHTWGQLLPVNQNSVFGGNVSASSDVYPFGSAPSNVTGLSFGTFLPFSISLNAV